MDTQQSEGTSAGNGLTSVPDRHAVVPEQQKFAVGDAVAWVSCGREKRGVVAKVIPTRCYPKGDEAGRFPSGRARNHESYVIRVLAGKTRRAQPRYYWPVVGGLRKIAHTELPRIV